MENFKLSHCFSFLIDSKTLVHQICLVFSSCHYIWTNITFASTLQRAWNKLLRWKASSTFESKILSLSSKWYLRTRNFNLTKISFWYRFLITQKNFLCTRDWKFPFSIRVVLLLENFTEENESPNFDKAMNRSRDKYQNASSPMKFLNETICNFTRNSVHQLSRIEKEVFSNNKVMVIIIYSRRKIQFLFNKKDADLHRSCTLYYGICSTVSAHVVPIWLVKLSVSRI